MLINFKIFCKNTIPIFFYKPLTLPQTASANASANANASASASANTNTNAYKTASANANANTFFCKNTLKNY